MELTRRQVLNLAVGATALAVAPIALAPDPIVQVESSEAWLAGLLTDSTPVAETAWLGDQLWERRWIAAADWDRFLDEVIERSLARRDTIVAELLERQPELVIDDHFGEGLRRKIEACKTSGSTAVTLIAGDRMDLKITLDVQDAEHVVPYETLWSVEIV